METQVDIWVNGQLVHVEPCIKHGPEDYRVIELCWAQWIRDTTGADVWEVEGTTKTVVGDKLALAKANVIAVLH